MNDSQEQPHLRADTEVRIGSDEQPQSADSVARVFSAKPDRIAEAFKVPIEMLRGFVPAAERIRFDEELAALIAANGQRFLEETWLSVPAIWGGIVIALFDFCSKWLQVRPLVTLDLLSKHEEVVQGFFDFFEKMGCRISEDPAEVSTRLGLRRIYWRQQALATIQAQQDEDRRRAAIPPRPSPGEVIAAFLARHKISEKELQGRAGIAKGTFRSIKNGKPVRPKSYTDLAAAMADIEPDFDRKNLLPE